MTTPRAEKVYEKYAWTILVALAILELLVSVIVLVTAYVDPTVLRSTIGMSLDQIRSSTPGIFNYIVYTDRNVGISVGTASVFGLAIAFKPYRAGQRWAWYVSWMWPVTYLAIIANDLSVGFLPPVVSLSIPISIAGLLIPYRKFFPRKEVRTASLIT